MAQLQSAERLITENGCPSLRRGIDLSEQVKENGTCKFARRMNSPPSNTYAVGFNLG